MYHHSKKGLTMLFKLKPLPAIVSAAFLAGGLTLAGTAQADVTLNAGAKMSSESNVFGITTKANELKDSYRVLSASAVYFTPLNATETTYFIGQVGANASTYSTYSSLDNSSVMASVGLYQQLSSSWSGTITGSGFSRTTQQDANDAKGNGATLEIKNQLSEAVWVKGVAAYSDSDANLASNSSTSRTYGASIGFLPSTSTFVNLGYNNSMHDSKTTAFQSTSSTVYADVTLQLAKYLFLNGGFASQRNDSNNTNFASNLATNNIASLGLNFSF